MSLPAPLMFTIGLIDQITKPIAKISQQFNGLASNYQAGTMKMASGIGGIAASGYALQNALMPAIEMDRALGEVKSLGVRQSALKMLTDTSYEYALKYGKSSTEFVKSSYDIQSAIAGLNDTDLSAFTLSSNVLAAATKADAATVTSYMGTMYGIFKNDAMKMGEGAWVERLTGMTATAVQVFKTDGKKMADAFGALGASAGLAPLQEQMAIMGTLQATMQGSESATKYKSFLAGVGKAQKALNLQFTDANGTMLPIVDILNKIKGKYGDVIDVAEGDSLKTAFGSQEAVEMVKLLLNDINGLNGSIESLGKVKGMEQAEIMAAAMTDQSERLAQSWYVIRAAFGTAVLPAFNSFAKWIADMGRDVMEFTQLYPELTKYMGYAAIGLLGLVAAGGLFTLTTGAGQMIMTTWGVAAMVWAGINAGLTAGLSALRGVMLAVNIAMYANPIGLIVAGIAAAVIAVGALIYYWDDLKAAMSDWGWVKAITGIFATVWGGVKAIFNDTMNWIIDKLNMIPGVDIDANISSANIPSVAAIAPIKTSVARGGITQSLSTANQQKSTNVGTVNVYPAKGDNVNIPAYLEMHA
jgi:TP901 family phage tail tape measure protein